jgi:hypothetical protein
VQDGSHPRSSIELSDAKWVKVSSFEFRTAELFDKSPKAIPKGHAKIKQSFENLLCL